MSPCLPVDDILTKRPILGLALTTPCIPWLTNHQELVTRDNLQRLQLVLSKAKQAMLWQNEFPIVTARTVPQNGIAPKDNAVFTRKRMAEKERKAYIFLVHEFRSKESHNCALGDFPVTLVSLAEQEDRNEWWWWREICEFPDAVGLSLLEQREDALWWLTGTNERPFFTNTERKQDIQRS